MGVCTNARKRAERIHPLMLSGMKKRTGGDRVAFMVRYCSHIVLLLFSRQAANQHGTDGTSGRNRRDIPGNQSRSLNRALGTDCVPVTPAPRSMCPACREDLTKPSPEATDH